MKKECWIFACGLEYDDFDDGGFDIKAICSSEEKAKQTLEELKSYYDKTSPDQWKYVKMKINQIYYN